MNRSFFVTRRRLTRVIGAVMSLIIGFNGILNAQNSPIKSQKGIVIKVHLNAPIHSDLFHLSIYDYFLGEGTPTRKINAKNDGQGNFIFSFYPISELCYVSLAKDFSDFGTPNYLLKLYVAEPGDTVSVIIGKEVTHGKANVSFDSRMEYKVNFKGKGAAKYKCKFELDSIGDFGYSNKEVLNSDGQFIRNNMYEANLNTGLIILNKYRKSLTGNAYDILFVDYVSRVESGRLEYLIIFQPPVADDTLYIDRLTHAYQGITGTLENQFAANAKRISAKYPQFLIDRASIGKYKIGNSKRLRTDKFKEVFEELRRMPAGELRDRTLVFFASHLTAPELKELIGAIMAEVETDYCLKELNLLNKLISKKEKINHFTLFDTDDHAVNLSSFEGKIVVIDFWFNGCLPCSKYYMGTLSQAEEKYKDNPNVAFISINVDAKKEHWIKGLAKGIYSSSFVYNFNTGPDGVEHPIVKDLKIAGYPTVLLMDRTGRLYNNDDKELRLVGLEGLIKVIDAALINP